MRRRPRSALPSLAALAVLLLLAPLRGAVSLPVRAEVDPAWTSIYVGAVTLRTTEFNRGTDGAFHATYTARVIPYFPANEAGVISIAVPDADLARLLAGEAVDFTGSARNGQGEARAVSGRATPVDVRQGRLKVRVRVSPRIELIFNTTYRFPAAAPEGLTPTGK
ncbi:MAG: hypothetical protein FJ397_13800 [Verrucomicrobia bacterium]|nr:hypothetical protein [Verrucomicrobiota bacterium]